MHIYDLRGVRDLVVVEIFAHNTLRMKIAGKPEKMRLAKKTKVTYFKKVAHLHFEYLAMKVVAFKTVRRDVESSLRNMVFFYKFYK